MKKLGLFAVCLFSLVLVGCGTSNPNGVQNTETVMLAADQQTESYKIYSEETFATAVEDGKRVVLNFRASRCPTCTNVSNDIIANQAQLPSDVVVLETDYDQYTNLKSQYNVRQQTTFVIFDENGDYLETVETIRSFNDLISSL